jgi:3-phenylpropionate/trans-cinnamate dioxygenase ferredoxin subunit
MAWIKVAKLSDFPSNGLKLVEAKGIEICLIKSGDKVFAVQEYCTHEDGPLHEGYLEDDGKILVCPWHAARFDISTGKAQEDTPWATDLKTYKVKIEGQDILVDV